MSPRSRMTSYRPLAISIVCLVLCLQGSAAALENVHDEIWFHPEPIPTVPQKTQVALTFDATVTAADLSNGLQFSIVETQPGGETVTLLEYAAPNLGLPPAGSDLRVFVEFSVACESGAERLQVKHTTGTVSFCEASDVARGKSLSDVLGNAHSVPHSETFGLAIADEHGNLGSLGPASTSLQCGAGSQGVFSERDALEGLRSKSRDFPRVAQDGDSGWLGVYFDAEGTQCEGTILPGEPGTVYIVARLNGLTACGAAGAEFRFTGLPESWTVFPVANPNMFVQGNPFTDGVIAVWPCETVTEQTVLLYTVLVLATERVENVEFHLERRMPYSNPMYLCPSLLMCDFPLYSYLCVETSPCYVNSSGKKSCQVPLAVQSATWGTLKNLYR